MYVLSAVFSVIFEFDHGPPMHCRNVQIFEQDQASHPAQVGLFETVLTAVLLARAARMCS